MIRKSIILLAVLCLVPTTSFAGAHVRWVGNLSRTVQAAVRVDVHNNGICGAELITDNGSLQIHYRSMNPLTRRNELHSAFNEVRTNPDGNAQLVIILGDGGIRSLTFSYPDGRNDEIVNWPQEHRVRDPECKPAVYRRTIHARYSGEVIRMTVQYIGSYGTSGSSDVPYDLTMLPWDVE